MTEVVSVETLRLLLRYDAETGKLFWLPRTAEMVSGGLRRAVAWNAHYAGKEAFINVTRYGYLKGLIFGRTYFAHRVAWALLTGDWPSQNIDHINGARADNRAANLRQATKAENARNRGPMRGRAFCGTFFREGSWHARCKDAGGKYHERAGFRSEEAAARSYDRMATVFHGAFARLNFSEKAA